MNADPSFCRRCCTEVSGLGVRFGSRWAIRDVNLHFHCGELTAVVGPNGGGKTTMFRAILGEVKHQGQVRFMRQGEASRAAIGYVPQRVVFGAEAPVSTLDLLAISLSRRPAWLGVGRATRDRAVEALDRVSAAHLVDRPLGALSGGELQRVLLATAMTPVPQLLLLDEPAAGMDAEGFRMFYRIVCDLRRQYDISILLVTHDVAAIAPHADRIVVLNRTVLADGPPREVLNDPRAREAIGPGLWTMAKVTGVLTAEELTDRHDG